MKNAQIENVRKFAIDSINSYPQYKEQIKEFWSLLIEEINNGESIHNECDLCIQSITDLITE
jgi:hypothetical protein